MADVTATWEISLNCTCPFCDEDVNLTDHDDFWLDNPRLQVGESNTERSKDMKVICPECKKEFKVDCQY